MLRSGGLSQSTTFFNKTIETKRLAKSAPVGRKRLGSIRFSAGATKLPFDRLRAALNQRLPCNYRRTCARLY